MSDLKWVHLLPPRDRRRGGAGVPTCERCNKLRQVETNRDESDEVKLTWETARLLRQRQAERSKDERRLSETSGD